MTAVSRDVEIALAAVGAGAATVRATASDAGSAPAGLAPRPRTAAITTVTDLLGHVGFTHR